MTPYADFLYLGVVLYVAAPTLIPGLAARRNLTRVWIVATTALMLAIQYWIPQPLWPRATTREIWLVLSYAVLQWGVARAFLATRQKEKSQGAYYAALAMALLPLAAVKFIPVVQPSFTLGFLGISYVTFRSIDVVINIQDGLITDLPTIQYLAYLLFFPTISAGPIDRYRRFAADWDRQRTRAEFWQDVEAAIHRIFRGLLYKFILAALIKQYWLDPASHGTGLLSILSYMYAYSLYLFFDFAGYSAFAIGFSYLLGIHTPENFHLPFLARNIRDFWDRWHITLSWWFRDHVYRRFVMAATRGHWFQSKHLASYLGFALSMGLMGLWHGTALHYIVYGLYHATLLIGQDIWSRWNKQHHLMNDGLAWRIVGTVVTFNAVCFGLLIFSGRLF